MASIASQSEGPGGKAIDLMQRIVDAGFNGVGPLKSSAELAQEYLNDGSYASDEARIDALINWETTKNFTTGFFSSLGGFAMLPAGVTAGLGSAWLIQARLVGAIATIYGHDVNEDRVRTLALITIAGDSGKEVVKRAGIDLSRRAGKAALAHLPGRVLMDINKMVTFRLITKAGTKGVVNLARGLPLLGGFVGGAVDAGSLRIVGAAARHNFRPTEGPAPSSPPIVARSFA